MSDSAPRSLHVLVADDEPMIVRALQRVLEKRGHRVEAAESADDGISKFESGEFDAVMVDRNMPGNGLSLLRRVFEREFGGFAVLMTGGLDDGELDGIAGEVFRLQKPFRFSEVVTLLEDGCA